MILNQGKSELLQDLMAVENILTELWRYHPNNPNHISLVEEYDSLEKMKMEIEKELEELS